MIQDLLHNPLAFYYLSAALMLVPVARIFMRAGFRPYWAGLLAVPEAGLILCLIVLALRPWQTQQKGGG